MPMSPHRLALTGFLAIVIAFVAIPGVIFAASGTSTKYTHPIVTTALKHQGGWGGQCWTFMQQVVFEATGKEVGFDYRLGFFEAGATEVSLAKAQEGDIIQITDDRDTSPSADYPGLHTAIVMENKGRGIFKVIDSNANWDEVVTVREEYDPVAATARYGNPNLKVHVYRINVPGWKPGQTTTTSAAASTVKWSAGDRAIVAADGDSLNLRVAPGASSKVITRLSDGSTVTILSRTTMNVDGRDWINVSTAWGDGWVATQYLRKDEVGGASSGGTRPISTWRVTIPIVSAQ
ncbi:MAG: SH3 domain-containing protein [Dehalococcoidia bacterium]